MIIILFIIFIIPLSLIKIRIPFQFYLIISIIIYISCRPIYFISSIRYCLGIDFISYGLIILTIYIIRLIVISTGTSINYKGLFLIANLLLCICLVIIFRIINLIYMYIFFEFRLIPLLIIVFGWGYQPERLVSGLYLFFYTIAASLPLLLFFIYIFIRNGNLFIDNSFNINNLFFFNIIILLAFLVKLPMFIFHFWLPRAHVQAPVFGSIILAGLLLKIGGYGIIRIIFLCETLFIQYNYVWFSLRIIGSILVRFVCLAQRDVKSIIAYSSIAHIAICIIRIITITNWGLFGTYILILSHGLCSSALFCLIAIRYDRYKRRRFFINKGLQNLIPSIAIFWFLICSFNIRCPPRLNFIREIYIISRIIFYMFNSIFIFIIISFLSACFRYYLFSFTQHGNFHYIYCYSRGLIKEYLLLTIHLLPILLILIILNFLY